MRKKKEKNDIREMFPTGFQLKLANALGISTNRANQLLEKGEIRNKDIAIQILDQYAEDIRVAKDFVFTL